MEMQVLYLAFPTYSAHTCWTMVLCFSQYVVHTCTWNQVGTHVIDLLTSWKDVLISAE